MKIYMALGKMRSPSSAKPDALSRWVDHKRKEKDHCRLLQPVPLSYNSDIRSVTHTIVTPRIKSERLNRHHINTEGTQPRYSVSFLFHKFLSTQCSILVRPFQSLPPKPLFYFPCSFCLLVLSVPLVLSFRTNSPLGLLWVPNCI